MSLHFEKGCSRMVFLIGRYAIKLPNLTYRYPACIYGLLHNFSERMWWRSVGGDEASPWGVAVKPLLCPVVAGDRFGLILVMRRARPLPKTYDCPVVFVYLASRFSKFDVHCPAEPKRDSYGLLDDRIVAIDYA